MSEQSQETVPAETDAVPEESVSDESVSDESVSDESVSDESVPVETVSDETVYIDEDPFASWPQPESGAVIEDLPSDGSTVEHVEGEIEVPDGYQVIEGNPS